MDRQDHGHQDHHRQQSRQRVAGAARGCGVLRCVRLRRNALRADAVASAVQGGAGFHRPPGHRCRRRGGAGIFAMERAAPDRQGHRASGRREARPRAQLSSGPRLSQRPALGRQAALGDVAVLLLGRRRLRIRPGHRPDVPDQHGGAHLQARMQSRSHAGAGRAAGHLEKHRLPRPRGQWFSDNLPDITSGKGCQPALARQMADRGRRAARHEQGRSVAAQELHLPHDRTLPPVLRALGSDRAASVRLRRHDQPRRLSARRNRRPPVLAGEDHEHRHRGAGAGPRPAIRRSGHALPQGRAVVADRGIRARARASRTGRSDTRPMLGKSRSRIT